MRIGEAVANLGLDGGDGEIIVIRIADHRVAHYRLDEVADKELSADLYLATGTYAPGSVTRHGGRTAANLVRITELPFDFDLSDFTGIAKADLWVMPDTALWPLVEALRECVEQVFGLLGLPICRMDYTGYGLAVFLRLAPHQPDQVPGIQQLHAAIVDRINAVARMRLADPQVKDAGTRIMRLAGCLNTKGAIPRQSRTLYAVPGVVLESQLRNAAGELRTNPPQQMIARTGATLDIPTAEQLIAAVQPHWTLGQKHHLALALSGLLAKAFVPEEQALAIVERLSSGDENPWDRAKSVHTTYERVRSGLDVKGFYGLRETLPTELVDWLDGVGQRIRQASAPTITFMGGQGATQQPEPAKPSGPEFFEPPDSAFHGWVGEYCDLMEPTTEAPRAFHLGVGLTTAGAMVGRHVHTVYGTDALYPNLYSLIVGRSGRTRKDTAIRRATTLLRSPLTAGSSVINHAINIATDVGSSVALINELKDAPNTLLYLTEFSRIMGNARRKGTETILPTLMEAFDTPFLMQNKSMGNPIKAEFPFLSIISATQPEILSGLMTSDDMHSGFANRWLFFCGNPASEGIADPPVLDKAVATNLLVDFWKRRNTYHEGAGIPLGDAARDWWHDWYRADFKKESTSPEEDAMRARHAVLIRKIALIYAIGEGATVIKVDHLERGVAIVEWQWRHVQVLLGTWGRSVDGQIEERIKVVLERGPVKRGRLQGQCASRKWAAPDFNKVFKAMVENQTVVIDPFGLVALNGEV